MDLFAKRQKQIIDFGNSDEFKALSAYYSRPSFFEALGVSRHENTHSNFIAWLLTPSSAANGHGLGDMPLRKFLEMLTLACSLPHARGKIPAELSAIIAAGTYSLSDITVEREKYIGPGRLDIYIEGKISFGDTEKPLVIVIENKIKSSEHDSQTKRYLKALRRSVSNESIFLSIFLTPLKNCEYEHLEASQCEAKEFIELNYQYLADYVIEPCRDSAPDGSVKRYLDEYLLTLSLPETRQDKGDIIMAVNKEERELLSRFWEKHKDLLTAVILSIGDYVPLEDAEKEIVSKAAKAIENAIQRDFRRFSWILSGVGNSDLPKNRLVLEIVTHYAETHMPLSLAELKQIFPDSLQGTFGVITSLADAQPEKFKGYKRYYTEKPIMLSDGPCAVSNQWRANNIDEFIAAAEKLGYKISSTG